MFECWGAQGYHDERGGKGAYVKGSLFLNKTTNLFLFIGKKGVYTASSPAFNGGGTGQTGGGGATDVRFVDGEWDNFSSLKSRIIVAAGGGGPDDDTGGAAGGLSGFPSSQNTKGGATQTSGGDGFSNGSFGKGGGNSNTNSNGNGAGGGGYYGGGSSALSGHWGGGGGSSFISGYKGCNAILESSTENSIQHSNSSIHYSGYVFNYPVMIDGKSEMPSPTSKTNEIGHSGNGYIRITVIKIYPCSLTKKSNLHNFVFVMILIQSK